MSDKDLDAQFAEIVAHWDDDASLPGRDRDASVDPDAPVDEVGDADQETGDGSESSPTSPPPLDLSSIQVWRGVSRPLAGEELRHGDTGDAADDDAADPDAEADEHFEPPPVAPLPPQEDLHFWGIVVGLVAGPLLLLWLVLFRPADSDWWLLAALALTVGGFVLLVLRQPRNRDHDDPDNGARV